MQIESNTLVDVEKAKAVWREYQEANDLSDRKGKIAGIDPIGGNVWIGDTMFDVYGRNAMLRELRHSCCSKESATPPVLRK